MTGRDFIVRVDFARTKYQRGQISEEHLAKYLHDVTGVFLGLSDGGGSGEFGGIEAAPDDPTLVSGPAEFGEAPRGWDQTADFTAADADQLNGGDDLEAPQDHEI